MRAGGSLLLALLIVVSCAPPRPPSTHSPVADTPRSAPSPTPAAAPTAPPVVPAPVPAVPSGPPPPQPPFLGPVDPAASAGYGIELRLIAAFVDARPPPDDLVAAYVVVAATGDEPSFVSPDPGRLYATDARGARHPVAYTELLSRDGFAVGAAAFGDLAWDEGPIRLHAEAVRVSPPGAPNRVQTGRWSVEVATIVRRPDLGPLAGRYDVSLVPRPVVVRGTSLWFLPAGSAAAGRLGFVTAQHPARPDETVHTAARVEAGRRVVRMIDRAAGECHFPFTRPPPPDGGPTPTPAVPYDATSCPPLGPTPVPPTVVPARTPFPPRLAPDATFHVRVAYGVGARNVLDTEAGTFTRDMVTDPPITVPLVLSRAELERIYAAAVRVRLWAYPERFEVVVPPGGTTTMITPASSYRARATLDGRTFEIAWDDAVTNPDPRAEALRGWFDAVRAVVEARDEFRRLPTPRGGYF